MTVLYWVLGSMLTLAASAAILRLVLGPSTLDRVVAVDMLMAIVICGFAVFAAFTLNTTVLPVMVVVALLNFVGAVSIARFLSREQA
jgi:multicomponent Na+:H+ antiporter subunit F